MASSATTPTPPPRLPHRAVLERILAAFAAGDVEGVKREFRPDAVTRQAASLPYGGTHTGHDEFITMLTSIGKVFELETHSYAISETDDITVLRLDLTFTSRATSRSARMPAVELYSFEDGHVSTVDVYYKDTQAVLDLLKE